MLVRGLCQNFIEKALPGLHKKRRDTLVTHVDSLLNHAHLTLTSLGRHSRGVAKVKHKINMTWRFLRNPKIQAESFEIYQGMCWTYLRKKGWYEISVDWSGCCSHDYYLLRASLVYEGRSIPIYNEIHGAQQQEDDGVHQAFLDKLHALLPLGAKVIIVTDAGFKTPWFDKVAALGWYFVGRVRGRIYCQLGAEAWQPAHRLHERMKRGETCTLGEGRLGKTSRTQQGVYFIGHFGWAKGRKKAIKYPDAHKMYSSSHSEPWILVTNLSEALLGGNFKKRKLHFAPWIREIYKKRMQIEQNFRDDKNARWGFGWRYSRTRDAGKIAVLCLIASIATLVVWLIGFYAEKQNLHYDFQVNTVKHHRVLSYFFLGKQVIMHALHRLNIKNLFKIIPLMRFNTPQHVIIK